MRNVIAGVTAALLLTAGAAAAQSGSATVGAFTISAEGLLFWYKAGATPTPILVDGPLADPETQVLLGGGELDTRRHGAFRVTVGREMNRRTTVEGSFLWVPTQTTSRSVESSGLLGSTDLLLPYIDAATGQEATTEISLSPIYGGSAREELRSGVLGAELNAAWAFANGTPVRLEALAGLRWMRLKETYTLTTSSAFLPPNPVDVWNTTDTFRATNNFYGVQLGARARYDCGRLFGTGSVKLGLGEMRQTVNVDGSLVTNDFSGAPGEALGPLETFAGGYFALPSNIGSHTRKKVAVLPELAVNIGYRITPALKVFAGYTFLYTNDVVRPGEQLDRRINTTQTVSWEGSPDLHPEGPTAPGFQFHGSSFWAQSFNVGVGYSF